MMEVDMSVTAPHSMFPSASHDEQARQDFLKSLRIHVTGRFHSGNALLFERKVVPGFAREHGRAPQTRKEIREALAAEPHNQWWGSLLRSTQEMLYDTVGPSIERQLPGLIDRARELRGQLGSLTLDPSLEIPRYHTAVDILCKPGGYHTELCADDVFAGAEFDRTLHLYSMGGLGPLTDDVGVTTAAWLRENHPDFRPARILDMGCTIGHSTLPWVDAYPDAEVHAIDVAAPCLRYGHARAVALGRKVHFSQQNAEHTSFEDGSFDVVVSQIMMHETSAKALPAIFRECHRLLRPGGFMLHCEAIDRATPFNKYYSEWMAHYNNEPFIGSVQDVDFVGTAVRAGFSRDAVFEVMLPSRYRSRATEGKTVPVYFMVGARKPG
jgi:ubiquinone/menaquinone biosynthesis C-methylase UbiE